MPSPKDRLSTRRDEIFQPHRRPVYLLSDLWPDFYAMLEIKRDASTLQIEEAIIEATSQLLAVNFSRGSTERLRLVERFLADFRLILLNDIRRARYDSLLLAHEKNDIKASPYSVFLAGEEGESLLQRARRRAQTIGERVKNTLRDSQYL